MRKRVASKEQMERGMGKGFSKGERVTVEYVVKE